MYEIRLHKHAARYYRRLDDKTQDRINAAMDVITRSPSEGRHVKALRGELEGKYRYDLGGIRIVYTIDSANRVVYVEAIGSRGDVYKG